MTSLPRFSVHNPVLVNLVMFATIVGGVYAALTLVREMFPESRPDQIYVSTAYPGATPTEVEKGISIKIEEQIKDIDGVDEMLTLIGEGSSTIILSLRNDVDDTSEVMDEVKDAVDSIRRTDFPIDAEETRVVEFKPELPVISATLYGELTDQELKHWGRRMRDDLLAIPGITNIELSGTRKDEISVEIHPDLLLKYGLSFMDVSQAIAEANLDLPGGQIKTARSNIAVRTLGEKDQGEAIAEIIVRSDPSGQVVRVSDIAEVIDGLEESDIVGRFNGLPAVSVTAYKTADQDAIDIAAKVKALVAGKQRQPFEESTLQSVLNRISFKSEIRSVYEQAYNDPYPAIGRLQTHTNLARFIEGRLDLLTRNGSWGLLLVFLSLLTFLNWRVAFWVMMGLVLAILGTLVVMKIIGLTLNLISMFGLIIVLGMLVDDAIIVGENVFTHVENGMEPKLAAIHGTEEVTWPVVCAIATTTVAFAPLLFIEGQIGDFMGVLPLIVVISLGVSLFEALTILPSHLAEWLVQHKRITGPVEQETQPRSDSVKPSQPARGVPWWVRFRQWQRHWVSRRLPSVYERFLRRAVSYRYVTTAIVVAALIVCLAAVGSGHVPLEPFPKMDSEMLLANLRMAVGTPMDATARAARRIEEVAMSMPEMASVFTLLGAQMNDVGTTTGNESSHLGQVFMELKLVEERDRTSDEILNAMRQRIGPIAGASSLKFETMTGGPGGAPVHVEIRGERVDDLVAVAERIKHRLAQFAGVYDISDDFDAGRREAQIELLDSGRALGLTTKSLATQVRAAFYGLEARKVQRDREDVKIMVRYPGEFRQRVYDIESMWISTPQARQVPFTEIARLTEGTGYAAIRRKDQLRTVSVLADIDEGVTNSRLITSSLATEFPKIERTYPGVRIELGGQRREFAKSFGSLYHDFIIALLLIYLILAGLFRSYVQPLVVMAAIPFGLIGAVVGHAVMGMPLTIMSLIGMVALTGIVVNDSLILLAFVNRRVAAGDPLFEAVIAGGRSRLRAILLTSVTTIVGLAPLMAERSFQARFLIPMGISITFGLAFATVLTLVVVPCFHVIVDDAKQLVGRARHYLPRIVPEV